jgi:hypothetical protein
MIGRTHQGTLNRRMLHEGTIAMRWAARLIKCVTFALIFTVCFMESASAQKRFALVIGNKDYAPSVGPLKNPVMDSRLIAGALAQIGFQVVPVNNATRVDINREVSRFATKLGDAGENAIGFLYYSGHGAARARDRVNYLIPVDITDMSTEDFWFDAVSLDSIVKELVNSAPRASLFVVFDACRNELRLPIKSTSKGFESMRETNGVFIAFSTSPNDVATDVGDLGGPYARALASELVRSGQDQLTLFQNVKENVFGNTGNRQRPWESNGFVQRIYLAGKPKEASKPSNEPDPGLQPNPYGSVRPSPSLLDNATLKAMTEDSLERRGFNRGLLETRSLKGRAEHPICMVNSSVGSCKLEAFAMGEYQKDVFAHTCDKINRTMVYSGCVNGEVHGLAYLRLDGEKKGTPQAYIGLFVRGRAMYPLIDTFIRDASPAALLAIDGGDIHYVCASFPGTDSHIRECPFATRVFGSYLMSEAGVRDLKSNTFDLDRVAGDFMKWWRTK